MTRQSCLYCEEEVVRDEVTVCTHAVYHRECVLQRHGQQEEVVLQCGECGMEKPYQPVFHEPYLFTIWSMVAHAYLSAQFFYYLVTLPTRTQPHGWSMASVCGLITLVLLRHARLSYEGKFVLVASVLDGVASSLWLLVFSIAIPLQASLLLPVDAVYLSAVGLYLVGKLLLCIHQNKLHKHLVYQIWLTRESPLFQDRDYVWLQSDLCSFCGCSVQQGIRVTFPCRHMAVHRGCLLESEHGALLQCAYCDCCVSVVRQLNYWILVAALQLLTLYASLVPAFYLMLFVYPTFSEEKKESDTLAHPNLFFQLLCLGSAATLTLYWAVSSWRPNALCHMRQMVDGCNAFFLFSTLLPLLFLDHLRLEHLQWFELLALAASALSVPRFLFTLSPPCTSFLRRNCYALQPAPKQA